METPNIQGVRTTTDSSKEGRLKVDVGGEKRRRKRKILRGLIKKA